MMVSNELFLIDILGLSVYLLVFSNNKTKH